MHPKLPQTHRREADGRSAHSHRGNLRHAEPRQNQLQKSARDDKGDIMELVGKHIKGIHRRNVPSPTSAEDEDDDKEDEGEGEGDEEEGDEEDSDESTSTQHSSGESEEENSPRRNSFEDKPSSNPPFVVLSVSRPRAIAEPPRAEQKAFTEKERTPRTRAGSEGMARGFRSQIKEIRRQKAGHEPSPERGSVEAIPDLESSEARPATESRPIATPERRRHSPSQSPRNSSSLVSPAGSPPSTTSFASSLPSLLSITSQASPISDRSDRSDGSGSSSPTLSSPRQPTLITFNNPSSTNPIVNASVALEKLPPTIIMTPSPHVPSPAPLPAPPTNNGATVTFNGPTISFTGPNFGSNNFLASSPSLTSTTTTMPRPLSSSSLSSLPSFPSRVNSPFNLSAQNGSQTSKSDSSPESPSISSVPPISSSAEFVLDGTLMIGAIIRSISNLSNVAGVLNGQVDRFCAIVDKQTRDKNDHLIQVWHEVRKTVQNLWEGGVVETYGSFVTGLSLPSSDLDMVISSIGSHPKVVQMAVHALKRRAGLVADWQPSAQEWFERLTRPSDPWVDTLAQELYDRLLQDAASESELIAHPRSGRSTLVLGLLALALELREQPWVHNLNPIITAKVPVIKLNATVYDHPPVVVDISFTERTLNEGQSPPLMSDADGAGPGHLHFGTAAARLVQAYIQDWPHLKKLALVLKQFLYIQNLHDTYTGGLSSYCLVVMIVSFLQAASQTESLIPHASNQPHPCSQVAVLLIAFLDFYSERFDYKNTGIRVCMPSTYNHNIPGAVIGRNCAIPGSFQNFFKLPRESPTLYIEDPFNAKNNIGQSVFQFWKVSQAFSGAHKCMVDALQGKDWQSYEALCLLVGQINVPTSSSLPPMPLSLPQSLSPLSLTLPPLSNTLLPPSLPMTLSLTAQPLVPMSVPLAIQPAMLLAPNGLIPYSDDLVHPGSHIYSQRRDRHGLRNGHQP